ncbi:MAG: ABC transporter permease [Acidimicrobiales bacterium]
MSRTPRAITVIAAFALALLVLPLLGLLERTPWQRVGELITSDSAIQALRLSLVVSSLATLVVVLLGFPLAWLLARSSFRGRDFARTLVLLPMVLPPVVGGTALLFALGRRGFVGELLDRWFGIVLLGSTAGAVIAAAFVALPFFVVTVESALREADIELEEAAATLGATPTFIMGRVTLPQIRSSVMAGLALAWARALGEFGATITFAGNRAGRTRTLPLEIFIALESDPDAAIALSLVLVAVSLVVLVSLRGRWLPR